MSLPSGISISRECLEVFNRLRSSRGRDKPKFIIYKISDDQETVVVEEASSEQDYEVFRHMLVSAVDKDGNPSPRFAVYDVEYDLGQEGKRTKTVFIHWVPENTAIKPSMIYASTKEQLRMALGIQVAIHADSPNEIEWGTLLEIASGGKA